MAAPLHGVIGYPVTPLTEDGIDTAALTTVVERLVDAGVHAIAPLGSTGELAYLDEGSSTWSWTSRSRRWPDGYRYWWASPT